MSEISKSEDGKLLVDGKSFDAGDLALSDDELGGVAGGVKVYTETHWYGNKYIICGCCNGSDWDIIGTNGDNVLVCRCKKCGQVYNDIAINT